MANHFQSRCITIRCDAIANCRQHTNNRWKIPNTEHNCSLFRCVAFFWLIFRDFWSVIGPSRFTPGFRRIPTAKERMRANIFGRSIECNCMECFGSKVCRKMWSRNIQMKSNCGDSDRDMVVRKISQCISILMISNAIRQLSEHHMSLACNENEIHLQNEQKDGKISSSARWQWTPNRESINV